MPKKSKLCPFGVFLYEFKKKNNLGMAEATQEAGKLWQKMGEAARAPYVQKSKNQRDVQNNKLTCTGIPLDLVFKEEKDNNRREQLMFESILNTVQNGVVNQDIGSQRFYFIMTNYFLKSLRTKLYIPAEIALCEYSLNEGVNKIYHTFFAPDENETFGNLYDAIQHSEQTHRLPCPPNALGSTSKSGIFKDIVDFITEDGKIQPLFTANDNRPIVESILNFLSNNSSYQEILPKLKVYSIQYLFYELKRASCAFSKKENPISKFVIDSYFDRDIFEYEANISCQFHEENDRTKYCSQSFVTRWSYMISEYVCQDFRIPLLPGQHMPQTTKLNAIAMAAPIDDEISIVSDGTYNSYLTNPLGEDKHVYKCDEDNRSWTTVSKKNTIKSLPTGRSKLPLKPDQTYFNMDLASEGISDNDDRASIVSFGRGRGTLTYAAKRLGRGRSHLFD